MQPSIRRRISVSTYWAASRIDVLDNLQRFEESFAVTEEFREWITCTDERPELLESSILMVPDFSKLSQFDKLEDQDEMLEI